MPGPPLQPDHPRSRRRLRRRSLLVLPALLALAAAPPPAPVLPVAAVDCPLPPELCPPSTSAPTPAPTPAATPVPPTPAPTPAGAAPPLTAPPPAAPRAAATPRPAPAPPPPGAAPAPGPPGAGPPATGLLPQSHDATPVRTVGTASPTSAAVRAWQVVTVVLVAIGVAALLVLRWVRLRRRAAIHARFNRMRVERGMPPLTPRQIDFLGPRRRY